MAGTVSFGGLASGLDTKKIVDQLVQLKATQLLGSVDNQITDVKTRQTALAPVTGSFRSLRDAAKTLKDATNTAWTSLSGSSSDTNTVVVTGVNSATAIKGTYNISSVSALAKADRVIFSGEADASSSTFGTGTVTITYKGAATNITIDSTNNTLNGIMSAINSAEAGVTASIINDGDSSNPYRLVLTANDTGADTTITQNLDTVLTGLAVDAAASGAAANEPADAAFQINNVAMTSATNIVASAIPGVTFNLVNTNTTTTTVVTIKQNTATIVANISSFVSAYSSLRTLLRAATLPDANGKMGPLAKETILTSANVRINDLMMVQMRSLTSTETYDTLADIGITEDSAGTLKVDTAKLTAAVEADVLNVRDIFQGTTGENGIAENVHDYLDSLLRAGGILDVIDDNSTSNILYLQKLRTDREKQLELYKNRLLQKFNNLELVISKLRIQENQVSSFASLYSSGANRLL